jgi:catechol 2,3-dioxygenase-like lactoylglutathione lyase family enzyme
LIKALEHIAIQCSSKEKTRIFFEEILELKKTDEFKLYSDLSKKIFNSRKEILVEKYANEKIMIEVFYSEKKYKNEFEHYCFVCDNREKIVLKAKEKKFKVKEFEIPNKKWIFLEDFDGNLFELKE